MSIVDDAMLSKVQAHLAAQKEEVEKEKQKQIEKEKRLAEKGLQLKKEKEKRERQKKEKGKRKPDTKDKKQEAKPAAEEGRRGKKRRERPRDTEEAKTEGARPSRKTPKQEAAGGETQPRGRRDKRRRGKAGREKKEERDKKEVQQTIRQTMAAADGAGKPKRPKRKVRETGEEVEEGRKTIQISERTSVGDLANLLGVTAADVIGKCMGLGMMVTINQSLDADTIIMIADEFDYDAELVDPLTRLIEEEDDPEEEKTPRAPVVTIMGHVDHGKTSLLDYIRKSNIISKESGGITQHIGAYSIEHEGSTITFIDTPGHQAFTSMRARGAQVTDIVILVVAASEHVMPQTIEAIDHAKAAQVPIVVAINKIDLPNADPNRIRQELTQHGLIVEEYGGDIVAVEISAKHGSNVDKLLEMVLLQAEMRELKAKSDAMARGVIIESRLDRGRGPVATVLVQRGTLEIGDNFVAGIHPGRVRAMLDDMGKRIKQATPSTPVEVLGFNGLPEAGDSFIVVEDERTARSFSSERQQIREDQQKPTRPRSLDTLWEEMGTGQKDLNLIIKADTAGSVEALSDSISRLTHEEVKINIISRGIGGVTESDVSLATASDAIIIAYHVTASSAVREDARQNNVEIRSYRVIFEAVDELKKAMAGLLKPEVREVIIGLAEVRAIFNVPKVGQVAGCYVKEGVVRRNARARVIRDQKIIVQEDALSSLRRFKDDVREVQQGFECGIGLTNFSDIKVGDQFEFFEEEEIARSLD